MNDDGLLARLATEPPAALQRAYRLLVGECPRARPEQSEVCEVKMSRANDVLNSIERHLDVPLADGPRATGFPAEVLADLEEGRRRRLARRQAFAAFIRADLGALYPYAEVPLLGDTVQEAEVVVHLAGLAELRRLYLEDSAGWRSHHFPFDPRGNWAVLPRPAAPAELWHYAADLPGALALADELGPGYHRSKPAVDRPRALTLEQRALDVLRDALAVVYGPGILPIT